MERNGNKVLIIGASSSLGRKVTDIFLENNYHVYATYNKNPNLITPLVAKSFPLDLHSDSSISAFSSQLAQEKINFNVVVLLSGSLIGKSLQEYSFEEITRIMSINFVGQAKVVKEIIGYLCKGSLVTMLSSISGQRGSFDPIYASSKGAIISFVKSMSTWYAPNIRFNAIAPGLIDASTMYEQMSPGRIEFHKENNPMHSFPSTNEVAHIIFDLTQDHWGHVNGEVIKVNGGSYV